MVSEVNVKTMKKLQDMDDPFSERDEPQRIEALFGFQNNWGSSIHDTPHASF